MFWRTAPSVLAVRSDRVLLVVVTEDVGHKLRVGLLGLDLGLGLLLALLSDLWFGLTRTGRIEGGLRKQRDAVLGTTPTLPHPSPLPLV